MPLVAHSGLPTFARLAAEGCAVLPADRAAAQDIRELHIGLLNMMPDAALGATERQFFRLIGDSNQIAQFHVHPFTLPQIARGPAARAYIAAHYETFESVREAGLDALIVTGANPDLSSAPFYNALREVMDWAWEGVTSTLCSCLATHALMQFRYDTVRTGRRGGKLLGVYRHRVVNGHPLTRGMNTVFDVPHSRFNEITDAQFSNAGMRVLVRSNIAGVHMAVSRDGLRTVCLQGHPEYDTVSILKEYKREIGRYGCGERADYPPLPERYFAPEAAERLAAWRAGVAPGAPLPDFPEDAVVRGLENTWRDSARALIGNWIGLVYQVTSMDRARPFMDGVDPDDPLGLGP